MKMTIAQGFFSGLLQGVTEFLPVSSSGHLVILHRIFGFKEPQIVFDVMLHLATLAAVIIVFFKDIAKLFSAGRKMILFLAAGSVPAVLGGLFFLREIEKLFIDVKLVGLALIFTSSFLFLADRRLRFLKEKKAHSFSSAVFIGLAQAVALLPGVSRSGMTVSTGLIYGLGAEAAYTFSFLLSVPAIAGAALLKIKEGAVSPDIFGLPVFVAMLTALLVGIFSLKLLLKVLIKGRLYIFGIYCFLLGLSVIFLA